MKLKAILLIVAISLIGCAKTRHEVVIEGKISGKNIAVIEYTVPINGIFSGLMSDSIRPDTSGNFRIEIPIEKAGFILLSPVYKATPIYKTQGILIADPGSSYKVVFDSEKDKDNFQVTGKNEDAINQYNKLPNPILLIHSQGINSFIRDSVASSIREKIKSQREKEIAIFKDLFDKGEISKGFLKLVQTDRYCYYAAVTALVVRIKYENSSIFRDANMKIPREQSELLKYTDEMKDLWEESFRLPDSVQADITRSPWWVPYYEEYIESKGFMNNDVNTLKLQELGKKGLSKTFHIDNGAKKYLPAAFLETYFANYIYSNCFFFREFQDYELITLYDQFISEYPNSKYTRFITPWINKYKNYQKTISETGISEKIKFIDNYQHINNLKECLSAFKDKKVYIDVWATWCAPCREEFAKSEKLREILRSKGMEILYISIDEDRNEKNWKDLIKYYNLEGYHIRASSSLCEDLEKIQNSGKGLYVPWHILFDEEGNKLTIPSEIAEL